MKHIIINNYVKGYCIVPAALCLSVIFTGCGTAEKKEEKEKTAAAAVVPVTEAFLLQKGKLSASIQIPGELIPFQQVDLCMPMWVPK
jgi:membrane fusion protein, multidrug efflux system